MARKFSELRAKMSPAARARAKARARAMLAEMPLQELRLARGLSQEALAATLKVRQASISKLQFFRYFSYVTCVVCVVCLATSARYFLRRAEPR